MTALRVLIDGASLPDGEARAFWKRFSDWMEEHPSDLAGFASVEGLASVHPEMAGGTPVLIASRSEPQRPYAPAAGGAPVQATRGKPQSRQLRPPRRAPRGRAVPPPVANVRETAPGKPTVKKPAPK